MRRMRKLTVLLMFCLAISCITVSAADERLGTVVDGSLLTDDTDAESVVYPLARGVFLADGLGRLTITGSRTLCMAGSTTCYSTVDQVNVTLFLQRLEGNSWVNVQTPPTKSAYNTYYVSNSKTYSVSGGYYYRIYGSHSAYEGNTSEALSSCTNGLWVD